MTKGLRVRQVLPSQPGPPGVPEIWVIQMFLFSLDPKKYGSQTSDTSFTRELVSKANSQALPQAFSIRNSGDGAQQSLYEHTLQGILMHT